MDLQNISLTLKTQRDNLDRVSSELAAFRQKILSSAMAITTQDVTTLDILRSFIMGAVGSLEASTNQIEQFIQIQEVQSLLTAPVPEVLAAEDEAAIANEELALVNKETDSVRPEEEKVIAETEDITATNPEINSKEVIEMSSNTETTKVASTKK